MGTSYTVCEFCEDQIWEGVAHDCKEEYFHRLTALQNLAKKVVYAERGCDQIVLSLKGAPPEGIPALSNALRVQRDALHTAIENLNAGIATRGVAVESLRRQRLAYTALDSIINWIAGVEDLRKVAAKVLLYIKLVRSSDLPAYAGAALNEGQKVLAYLPVLAGGFSGTRNLIKLLSALKSFSVKP